MGDGEIPVVVGPRVHTVVAACMEMGLEKESAQVLHLLEADGETKRTGKRI